MAWGYANHCFLGINYGYEKLEFDQTEVCPTCHKPGHIEIIMSYMYIAVFFKPLLKWHKRYYVQMDCCKKPVKISETLGQNIADKKVKMIPIEEISDWIPEEQNG